MEVKPANGRSIFIIGGVFVVILLILVATLLTIGKAYRGELQTFTLDRPEPTLTLRKTKNIKKITIQQDGKNECIEVTPDGVVRVYETCDSSSELINAARLVNPQYILQLFKKISEKDQKDYATGGAGTAYTLQIETDEGSETITIIIDDSNDDIIEVIDNVIDDIPQSSPNPSLVVSPSASAVVQISPSPFSSTNPEIAVSPEPSADQEQPFTCNFSEDQQQKPYRVSNIVCSDEPQ